MIGLEPIMNYPRRDSIKRKHVHELKRIFQILLDHQGLKVLGTVNVIVDEVRGRYMD